jgi:SAM-dependent methyltransferase
MASTAKARPSTPEVAAYFNALYPVLASSPAHDRIGRMALGDAYTGQLGFAGARELVRLTELAGVRAGERVLDLCCGRGGAGPWLARRSGAVAVGLDCSAAGLRNAAQKGWSRGVLGDIDCLPFAAASFDALVCLDGFSFNLGRLASECVRVLRPGARFAFLVSLPCAGVAGVIGTFEDAGFAGVQSEDATAATKDLLSTWLASYRRQARGHTAEVGDRVHRALTDEMRDLVRGYESGKTVRVYLTGERPSLRRG